MVPSSRAIIETNQDKIRAERHLHFYNKGEIIPLNNQGIWQVCQGLVRLSTLYPVGEEGILGWAGSSMCFGSCFSHLQTYRATAMSDVCLMWYTMIEIEVSPTLAQELLPQLGRRFRQTEALLAIAGQRRVEDRLHQLLLLLKQEFGQLVVEGEGTRLNIRLTHQDIASAICTTRVTVTRLLGKLQQQGWLSKDSDRHIILKDEAFGYSSDLFGFGKSPHR